MMIFISSYHHRNKNSIQLFIITVLTQQPHGQLQRQPEATKFLVNIPEGS